MTPPASASNAGGYRPLAGRRPATRRLVALLSVLIGGLLLLPGAAQAASAPATVNAVGSADGPSVTWEVQPTQAKGQAYRPNFSLTMDRGQSLRDTVRIRNYSAGTLKLDLYATDAFNSESGAIDLLPGGKAPKDAGRWISLPMSKLTIAAGNFVDVPFTIKVPSGVSPGDHTAGIVTSYLGDGVDGKGTAVQVDRRLGTRVQVRVAGQLVPKLTISDLNTSFNGPVNPAGQGTTTSSYTVTNDGNVRMAADQQIKVSGPFGVLSRSSTPPALGEILPGNSIRVTQKIDGLWPSFRSTTKVTLVPKATREGDTFPPDLTATAKQGMWTIPWAFLATMLILLALYRLRQRRQRRFQDINALELEALVDARMGQPAGTEGQLVGAEGERSNGHATYGTGYAPYVPPAGTGSTTGRRPTS